MNKIDPAKGWYTAQELAGLPGLPGTDRGVRKVAQKNLWSMRSKERGKGDEYAINSLPTATQHHILSLAIDQSSISALPSPLESSAVVAVAAPGDVVTLGSQTRKAKADDVLTDAQRAQRDGGVMLCRAIEAAMAAADCSCARACQELAARLVERQCSTELIDAALVTYTKPRKAAPFLGGAGAMASRLQKMMGFYEQGRLAGDVGLYLVPGKREKEGHNPVHIAAFLRHFCRPTQPPVAAWHRDCAPGARSR